MNIVTRILISALFPIAFLTALAACTQSAPPSEERRTVAEHVAPAEDMPEVVVYASRYPEGKIS